MAKLSVGSGSGGSYWCAVLPGQMICADKQYLQCLNLPPFSSLLMWCSLSLSQFFEARWLFPTCLCMPDLFLDRRKWNNDWYIMRDSICSSIFLLLAVSFCQMSFRFMLPHLTLSLLCFHMWDLLH